MAIFGQNSAFVVILLSPFEVEGRMIAKNDTLDDANIIYPGKNFRVT